MPRYEDPNELTICKAGHHSALPVYQYIRDWVNSNKRKQKEDHFKEGRFWTYGTLAKLAKEIPGMTVSKIRTAVKHLKQLGVIIVGCFNVWACDRTTWYSVVEPKQAKVQQDAHLSNADCKSANADSITCDKQPCNTNVSKQYNKPIYSAPRDDNGRKKYGRKERPAMITREVRESDFDSDPLTFLRELDLRKA